eukprot:267118-Prorocentrum_minimum.AAC.1
MLHTGRLLRCEYGCDVTHWEAGEKPAQVRCYTLEGRMLPWMLHTGRPVRCQYGCDVTHWEAGEKPAQVRCYTLGGRPVRSQHGCDVLTEPAQTRARRTQPATGGRAHAGLNCATPVAQGRPITPVGFDADEN